MRGPPKKPLKLRFLILIIAAWASLCEAAPRVEERLLGRFWITGDGGYLGRGDGSRDYEKEMNASDEGLLEFFETERVGGNSVRSWRLFWISSVQFIEGKLCLKFLSQAVNSGDGWVGSPLVVGFGCKAWDGKFTALEQQVILKLLPQLLSPLPDGISSDLAREMGAEVAGRPIVDRGGLPIAARYSWFTVSNLMRNAADYLQAKNHARQRELDDVANAAQHGLIKHYGDWSYGPMVLSLWGRGLTAQVLPASAEIAALQDLALGQQTADEFIQGKNAEFALTLAGGALGGGLAAKGITTVSGALAARLSRMGAGIAYEALQNAVPVANVPQLALSAGRGLGRGVSSMAGKFHKLTDVASRQAGKMLSFQVSPRTRLFLAQNYFGTSFSGIPFPHSGMGEIASRGAELTAAQNKIMERLVAFTRARSPAGRPGLLSLTDDLVDILNEYKTWEDAARKTGRPLVQLRGIVKSSSERAGLSFRDYFEDGLSNYDRLSENAHPIAKVPAKIIRAHSENARPDLYSTTYLPELAKDFASSSDTSDMGFILLVDTSDPMIPFRRGKLPPKLSSYDDREHELIWRGSQPVIGAWPVTFKGNGPGRNGNWVVGTYIPNPQHPIYERFIAGLSE